MATNDIMILVYTCVAAFLAITNLISVVMDLDSKKNFMFLQWGMLVLAAVLFLVERGIHSL